VKDIAPLPVADDPHARPYTDADMAHLTAHVRVVIGWPISAGEAATIVRAVLDALVADGWRRGSRPTPHLDAVKAERDKLRDANDTLALTLAEAIGTLTPDGGGCSRGWIPVATVDRWRRALAEADEATRG